jgi:ATP-dependent Clp protease ATP-binding subunit ClpC
LFERFTERARQIVVFAQAEARGLKHNYIGTEHLLLGLLREEEGVAARALESLNVTIEEVRVRVARVIGEGVEPLVAGQIPFTPRAKKALELSLREAMTLGDKHIGTEHILLGIVRQDDAAAVQILMQFGADPETVRNEVVRWLSGPGRSSRIPSAPSRAPLGVQPFSLLSGWLLFGVSLGLGVLIGWAIWGL